MSDGNEKQSVPMVAITAAIGAIILLLMLLMNVFRKEEKEEESENEPKQKGKNLNENNSKAAKQKSQPKLTKKVSKAAFSHPWLASTLKGHSSRIVSFGFSPNGKYLISSSEDRALMLWSVKEFEQKEHKFIRGNVELDSATQVAFSPDSKAFVSGLANENAVRIYRLSKKEDGSSNVYITGTGTFPQKHSRDIIGLGISSSGKWIMTCSGDTTIIVWDLKGEVLATVDSHQMNNSCGKVSPCGRFIASSGFTPDVKVWEVVFDKTGSFKEVKRAFELKGHTAAVYSFDFSNDSSRMASVSKDNTWKYWNTDVQYALGQDAKLLFTGSLTFPCSLVALSPDGRTVALADSTSIVFWDAVAGTEEETLENVHTESINNIGFDISGRHLVSSGGKQMHVYYNVIGYKATIGDLEAKIKTTSKPGMKERLEEQLKEARQSLDNILSQSNGSAGSN